MQSAVAKLHHRQRPDLSVALRALATLPLRPLQPMDLAATAAQAPNQWQPVGEAWLGRVGNRDAPLISVVAGAHPDEPAGSGGVGFIACVAGLAVGPAVATRGRAIARSSWHRGAGSMAHDAVW